MRKTTALVLALALALASCEKQDACLGPGEIKIIAPGIVTWSNPTTVTIEVKGISWPGHAEMTPRDFYEYRIEGHALVRLRTECSGWSDWYEINKP